MVEEVILKISILDNNYVFFCRKLLLKISLTILCFSAMKLVVCNMFNISPYVYVAFVAFYYIFAMLLHLNLIIGKVNLT